MEMKWNGCFQYCLQYAMPSVAKKCILEPVLSEANRIIPSSGCPLAETETTEKSKSYTSKVSVAAYGNVYKIQSLYESSNGVLSRRPR